MHTIAENMSPNNTAGYRSPIMCPPLLAVVDAAGSEVDCCASAALVIDAVTETPANVAADVSAELEAEVVTKDELLVTVVA